MENTENVILIARFTDDIVSKFTRHLCSPERTIAGVELNLDDLHLSITRPFTKISEEAAATFIIYWNARLKEEPLKCSLSFAEISGKKIICWMNILIPSLTTLLEYRAKIEGLKTFSTIKTPENFGFHVKIGTVTNEIVNENRLLHLNQNISLFKKHDFFIKNFEIVTKKITVQSDAVELQSAH